MKSSNGIILGILLVVVIVWGVVAYQKKHNTDGEGLYVSVTDATADIKNVTDIDMTVKKVEVYSAAKGWTTVSADAKTYKLLSLNASGETKFYGKKSDLEAGTYDKVRVTLGDTTVRTKTKGDMKATLPTSQIVMNATIKVSDDAKSHLTLDFLADKSLHMTSDDQYVFAPVVKAESRSNADVTVSADTDTVMISGGTVDSTATVGVDLDGSSKGNFELKTGSDLKIQSQDNGKIMFMLGGKSVTSDVSINQENQAGTTTATDGSLNVNGSLNGSVNTNGSTSGGINIDAGASTNSGSTSGGATGGGSVNVNLGN
ncbi:MAG: DUF4382 domain-containing protein [Patescibacteria group bacterium]